MSEAKLMFVLWDDRTGRELGAALGLPGGGRDLRARLAAAGVRRVQLDLADDAPGAVRRQSFERPVRAVVAVWTSGPAAATTLLLRGVADKVAGWRVREERLLEPTSYDAPRAAVGIVRRRAGPDPWLTRWLEHQAAVATRRPTTAGYVQDVVLAAVTRGAPPVHAFVEETSLGLLECVATLGPDRELDLVPARRCTLELAAGDAG